MNFFARFKKVFLIIGFLFLIIVAAYFIWTLFFKTAAPLTTTSPNATGTINGLPTAGSGNNTGTDQTGGGLPITPGQNANPLPGSSAPNPNAPSDTAVGGLTKTEILNKTPSLDPILNTSGQVQYYDQSDGKFYKINSDGTKTLLSDHVFHSVQNITWAPDATKAILEYPDGTKILYNFDTQKQSTIPAHWKDFSFSPTSDKLISKSIGLDEENRWLVVSNDDGSKATALEPIGTQDSTVYPGWSPNNQIVALYTEGIDLDRQNVYFVGLNGENFKSTVIEGRGLQYQWSTTGDKILYSVYNTSDNMNPRLWIVDASSDTIGQNRGSLDIQTWASKCTFASNTEIYCAVPDNLPTGSGLYPELADETKDSLYKIDLATGSQKLIAVPDGSYNISQIMVGDSQDYLYFTDKFSGSIYKVNLK
jgi:hypothetical protein